MRTVLVTLLVVAASAGCAGPADRTPTETTAVTTGTTATAETTAPTTGTTATNETLPETADEPQKGDQFLSVMALNESQAVVWNASERSAFENLSEERQRVVEEAIDCDCNVELDGEFSFYNKERIEVVEYDGAYYFLRVAIV